MSTTKPDTETTGWTDRFPYKPNSGDEYHFVRRKDGRDVVVMGFSMGKAWLNGVSYEPSELRSHLFLGPLSPSDFEQLIRLRKAGRDALTYLDRESRRDYPFNKEPQNIAHALREALREMK